MASYRVEVADEARREIRRLPGNMRQRVTYLLEDEAELVTVLAVRKRPPYQYDDLEELLRKP